MKPETAGYLAKAQGCLDAARQIITLQLADVAAKEAYLAIYHAAHALVYETTGREVKTHSGLRTMFAKISKDEPHVDRSFTALLAQAYKFKEIADYGIGDSAVVTLSDPQDRIESAQLFVQTMSGLMRP